MECEWQPLALAENQCGRIKENMPWVSMCLRDPMHWKPSCPIYISWVGKKPFRTTFTFPSEVLAKLWSFNPQIQPCFWCWNNLWFSLASEFPYVVWFFNNDCQIIVPLKEGVAFTNQHHNILIIWHESTKYSSSLSPQCFKALFWAWISGIETKFPRKEVFFLRISRSLKGSNWVLSISAIPDVDEDEKDSLLPTILGDFYLLSATVSKDLSLLDRLSTSIIFSPSSTSPLQYWGYFVKTYYSTYCISVGVMGPNHLKSRPCSVEIASATKWTGITLCAFYLLKVQCTIKIKLKYQVKENLFFPFSKKIS